MCRTSRQKPGDEKNFAHEVSVALVRENTELDLATISKAKRRGKIFIDFFQNGSLRTKNGGAIALPIAWKDVKKVDPRSFHIGDVEKLLARKCPGRVGDP